MPNFWGLFAAENWFGVSDMNFQKGAGLLVGAMKLLGMRRVLGGGSAGCCLRGAGVVRLAMLKGCSSGKAAAEEVSMVWPGEGALCRPWLCTGPVAVSEWKIGWDWEKGPEWERIEAPGEEGPGLR